MQLVRWWESLSQNLIQLVIQINTLERRGEINFQFRLCSLAIRMISDLVFAVNEFNHF